MQTSSTFSIAASIFMARTNISLPFLIWGMMSTDSLSATLLLTISLIGFVFTSFVFSPAWSSLPFTNDNDFALHRFSGKGARILYLFRAFYVGGLVFTLIPALLINGFISYLGQAFSITEKSTLVAIGFFVLSVAQFSRTHILIKLDKWLFFIVIIAFFGSLFGLLFKTDWSSFSVPISLFPKTSVQWTDAFLYLSLIWWSTKILDGSGQDAQRLFHARSKTQAIWASLLPILFSVVFINVIFLIAYVSFPFSSPDSNSEFWVLDVLSSQLPFPFYLIILLSLFFLFSSTLSSFLDVGATYVVGGLQELYNKPISRTGIQWYLSVVTLVLSFYFDNMESLFKYILGISAGVGPVFVLRWFIRKINAYSQLIAMISAGLWFLAIDSLVPQSFFSFFEHSYFISAYGMKVILVTLLTTLSWVLPLLFAKETQSERSIQFFSILSTLKTFQKKRIFFSVAALSTLTGFCFVLLAYAVPILFSMSLIWATSLISATVCLCIFLCYFIIKIVTSTAQ